ncbi:MAG: response regulator [Clostridia bacterium]|nr:response regulator [Clostridia bacterium]
MPGKKRYTTAVAVIGGLAVLLIVVMGSVWMGQSARTDTERAVRTVSLMYLDELAGRREQVVESNLQNKIDVIRIAIDMMTEEDLSDKAHMEAYQRRMKALYKLDRFAFVDTEGLIYTATGYQHNIEEYELDHRTLSEPQITVMNPESDSKQVIVAVPVSVPFQGKTLSICFMAIDMSEMLAGVSMDSQNSDATFSNIYTSKGQPLTGRVLRDTGETNLLTSLKEAEFEPGYSYERIASDFGQGNRGIASFSYRGVLETLSYVPIRGTDCFLTYLIRESVISEQIGSITNGIINRSTLQSVLAVAVLLAMFLHIILQTRKTSRMQLEKETADVENRIKREELEQRLSLQEELLSQKKQREEQDRLITALASDYWSVYYLELDKDEGVCYQAHEDMENGLKVGERFRYLDSVTAYADHYVVDEYREDFLRFVQPENIRKRLEEQRVISFRYMVRRHGTESYEEVHFAGVRHPEDREDHQVHAVGACFVNVDSEARRTMEQNRALQEALNAAEAANKAKTAFLSNMSHEIRTPMNAIIGLDNIALNDQAISPQTRDYLEKIGSSARHLLNIINDILDMSRIESGSMVVNSGEFSFSRLLEQVNAIISAQCRDKGIHYECRTDGKIDEYYIGDDMKIRQVMINILGNAVKFTPSGGTVSFTVQEAARLDGMATLRFIISDTGIGMSKEYLPKLFDAFSQENTSTTSRYGSTGLGMSITKSMVELMNGHIEVESEKGVGTTFTVTVTVAEAAQVTGDIGDDQLRPNEMNVLAIDDDPIACQHAQLVLGQIGINCETAESGKAGLEMIRLRHARREDYSLILVDWKMPEMDGVETARQIRATVGHDTPIIILTSYDWDEIQDEAKRAGVDTFVAKPLFAGAVMEQFREAFKRKRAAMKAPKAELKGRRVLLAEDMQVNAEIMVMVLSMREIEVDVAENGEIAVKLFSSHPEGYYDAVLMDMRMPVMDGLEATREIRALNRTDSKTVPIIALTANAFDEDVQRSMQAGLNAHLSKPVDPETLFGTLETLIKDEPAT